MGVGGGCLACAPPCCGAFVSCCAPSLGLRAVCADGGCTTPRSGPDELTSALLRPRWSAVGTGLAAKREMLRDLAVEVNCGDAVPLTPECLAALELAGTEGMVGAEPEEDAPMEAMGLLSSCMLRILPGSSATKRAVAGPVSPLAPRRSVSMLYRRRRPGRCTGRGAQCAAGTVTLAFLGLLRLLFSLNFFG